MTHRYRNVLITCGLVMALLGGTVAGLGVAHGDTAAAGAGAASGTSNSITVSAGGDVTVPPDIATVTFGVLVTRESAQDAQDAANRVVTAAVRNLHALAIPDRRIQTVNVSLEPHYDNSGNVTGYQAAQTLAVVVGSLALVGRVVDAGVAAHANNNVSITYGLRNENAARTDALKLAVAAARARAEAAANALGRSLAGARVQLSENSQPVPQPVTADSGIKAAPATGAPTQAYGGTLTVHEDVTLTYTF